MSIQERLKAESVSIIPYLVIVVCAAFIVGSFNLYNSLAVTHWMFNLAGQVLAFGLLGLAHVLSTSKYFPGFSPYQPKGVLFSLFFSIVIASILSLLFYYKNLHYTAISVAAGASFFLPSISTFTYTLFLHLPGQQQEVWFKRNNLLENRAFVFLTSVSIKIKVAPLMSDKKEMVFTSTVPAQMEFGKVFHYFTVQQLNKEMRIDTEDGKGDPIGWLFYIEKWGGYQLKPIDPYKNLWENQVKPHVTIVARRVHGASVERAFQPKKAYEL